jgi:uncharacterized damage-inducible protein DinB
MPARTDARIPLLLALLDQAYEARAWHGTTLRGALRGLTPARALWRPGTRRHCVWELLLHCAYWKYAVRRRLDGEPRGAFARAPSNWPRLPAKRDAADLRRDLALLDREHRALRESVARLTTRELEAPSPTGQWRVIEMIHGVAAHDLYHTGQIQLIKRLMRRSG